MTMKEGERRRWERDAEAGEGLLADEDDDHADKEAMRRRKKEREPSLAVEVMLNEARAGQEVGVCCVDRTQTLGDFARRAATEALLSQPSGGAAAGAVSASSGFLLCACRPPIQYGAAAENFETLCFPLSASAHASAPAAPFFGAGRCAVLRPLGERSTDRRAFDWGGRALHSGGRGGDAKGRQPGDAGAEGAGLVLSRAPETQRSASFFRRVALERDARGSLGITLTEPGGCVSAVLPGGAAARHGGIELDDRIVEVGGVTVPPGTPVSAMLPEAHLPVVLTLERAEPADESAAPTTAPVREAAAAEPPQPASTAAEPDLRGARAAANEAKEAKRGGETREEKAARKAAKQQQRQS
jgi:hypothetical protein